MQSGSVKPKLNSATDGGRVVELANISKSFPGVIANRDISLQINRATIHAIVGENGAGKSTTLKMATGLLRPDSGQAIVDGIDVWADPEHSASQMAYWPAWALRRPTPSDAADRHWRRLEGHPRVCLPTPSDAAEQH